MLLTIGISSNISRIIFLLFNLWTSKNGEAGPANTLFASVGCDFKIIVLPINHNHDFKDNSENKFSISSSFPFLDNRIFIVFLR